MAPCRVRSNQSPLFFTFLLFFFHPFSLVRISSLFLVLTLYWVCSLLNTVLTPHLQEPSPIMSSTVSFDLSVLQASSSPNKGWSRKHSLLPSDVSSCECWGFSQRGSLQICVHGSLNTPPPPAKDQNKLSESLRESNGKVLSTQTALQSRRSLSILKGSTC